MPSVTLLDLQARGYCTDEWARWQQGHCDTYALALIQERSYLRLGVSGITENGSGDASGGWMLRHVYAHDGTHAYDSAGRHPLPYYGVSGEMDYVELDQDPDDWGFHAEAYESDLVAARMHAMRNNILPPEQET